MALTFKLDEAQFRGLIQALNDLSDNIGKWQAQQTTVVEGGFTRLVDSLGGSSEEQLQAIVDQLAEQLNLRADEIQTALGKITQPKGE